MAECYLPGTLANRCIRPRGHHGCCEWNDFDPPAYDRCRTTLGLDEASGRWVPLWRELMP